MFGLSTLQVVALSPIFNGETPSILLPSFTKFIRTNDGSDFVAFIVFVVVAAAKACTFIVGNKKDFDSIDDVASVKLAVKAVNCVAVVVTTVKFT